MESNNNRGSTTMFL